MPRFYKHKKEDTGQAPDALLYRGKQREEKPYFTYMHYGKDFLTEDHFSSESLQRVATETNGVKWLNLYGVHDAAQLSEAGATYSLDPVALAAIMDTYARPQIKWFGDDLYLSVKMLSIDEKKTHIHSENLVLYLQGSTLITFQERVGDVFDPVRKRIRAGRKRIRESGADYLFFALLDVVVDNYGFVLSHLGEQLEAMEDRVLASADAGLRQEIFRYKRELSFLRKQVAPIREMLQLLAKTEEEDLSESAAIYARDVQNTLEHVYEVMESYKDLLNDYFTSYHTQLSDRLNTTMRFLTVFSVIFIPLTFIAGIYGTNFQHIPELTWANGYFYMLALMGVVALVMILYFRRKKWL